MNLAKKGTIVSVKQIAKQTIEAAIEVPADFTFIAGQYIWLMIPELKYPDPRGNARMFSVASSPNKRGEIDIIFRMSGSGYKKTLAEMMPGEEVVFSGPYGSLTLPKDDSVPLVLIAGGVGVASFLSIVRFSEETRSGRKITLVYANPTENEAAYLDELRRIEQKNQNFKLFTLLGVPKGFQLRKLIKDHAGSKAVWAVIGLRGFVDLAAKELSTSGVSLRDALFEEFYPVLLKK